MATDELVYENNPSAPLDRAEDTDREDDDPAGSNESTPFYGGSVPHYDPALDAP